MQIRLNNRTEEFTTEGLRVLGDLMQGMLARANREGGTVLAVKVNGEDVTGKDRTELDQLPIDEIEQLEIQTGDPKELAHATLYSIADFLEKLLTELLTTAELFRLGSDDRSNQSFLRCIDGMQVFMHSMEQCRRLLGLSFELMNLPDRNGNIEQTVGENRRSLFGVLDSMIEAHTNRDWILLADLLEHELIPLLEEWRLIIPAILKEIKMRGGSENFKDPSVTGEEILVEGSVDLEEACV